MSQNSSVTKILEPVLQMLMADRLELDADTRYENRPDRNAPSPGAWMHVVYRFHQPRPVASGEVVTLLVRSSRMQIRAELAEEATPF